MSRQTDRPAAAPDAPRHAFAWASVVYALSTLALGYPALFGRFLVNPMSDQYIAGYAFRQFAAESLRGGHGFPQWNPYLYGGMPYVAAMHGDIFYPTFLLRMAMPTDVAMTWGFIIHIFLAGLFTYAFLRAAGLSFFAALAGGVVYMMSGPISSYVSPGHDGKLFVSALFPLSLWMLIRGVRDGRPWAWGVLALTIGLAVLSPHPQLLQYMLLGSGAFALYLAFSAHDGRRLDRRVAVRRLAHAFAAVLVGGLMGAVQYLPVREYVDWSPRAGGKGWDHAVSYSMPLEELVNTYLPQFTGILENYWGRNGIHFHSEYLGGPALLLAGAALGWRDRPRSFVWFWVATLVVTVLWALGGNTPFYHLVYAIVPGTKYFRAPSTILYIVAFSVAVLAAVGTERAVRGLVSVRYLAAWAAFGALMAVLASTGALTNLATAVAAPELYERVVANGGSVTLGAWRSLAFVLVTAALIFACTRGKLSHVALGWALTAVLATDFWTVLRLYWRFSPPAAVLYSADPTVEYLKRQQQPGRVLALPLSRDIAPHDPMLSGDGLMVHDIRQVLGYHGNELGRYQTIYSAEGSLANPNFWQLYNVRHLLTNTDQVPIDGAVRVAGPAKDAAGTTVYLFQLPGDNTAAWVAPAIVKAPDEATLATVLDPRFPIRSTAIFDSSADVTARTDLQRPPAPLSIRAEVAEYRPGRIRVNLDGPAPEGAALVVSENYFPGWRANVDGQPAMVARADYTLLGVPLPAGARRVELTFEDPAYERGKAVTLLAVALALLATAAGVLVARRRRG